MAAVIVRPGTAATTVASAVFVAAVTAASVPSPAHGIQTESGDTVTAENGLFLRTEQN